MDPHFLLHRTRPVAVVALAVLAVPAFAQKPKIGTSGGDSVGKVDGAPAPQGAGALEQITVTGSRLKLIGTAVTASQGVVSTTELNLLPAYRPAQLVETVPGMVATVHSGEGKASQYLLRGYNLDHGDDFAFYVAGVPVNEPTHAHGQGYSDLNFLIPEIVKGITYTKGTYYAAEGNFASVGSAHISYAETTPSQILVSAGGRGSKGFDRVLLKGSKSLRAGGDLLGALDLQHYDGPWVNPDNQRKVSSVLRYSHINQRNGDGYSITGMFYHDLWNATTDQPQRAITQGLIGRFGSLDPSDGGYAQRSSVSAQYHALLGMGQLDATGYLINNRLTLWNDFTHYLFDPINGDQEAQHENRVTLGGDVSYEWSATKNDFAVGFHTRSDSNDLYRLPTQQRVLLTPAQLAAVNYPASQIEKDRVHLRSVAVYFDATTHWTSRFRTVLGFRENYMSGSDSGTNAGTASATLAQPKVNLIFQPTENTELYLSWGRGFHSDDLRGVTQAQRMGSSGAPLIAHQTGEEFGVRHHFASNLTGTLAIYNLDAQSETTYDPDVGQDAAGPGSRRHGYTVNLTYQPFAWLEFYGTYSANHARYTSPYDDGTGHVGFYLPNAPFSTGSFNVYVKEIGHWNAGVEYRDLGKYPLSADNVVQGHGYHEWNGDVSYTWSGWKIGLFLDNILNEKADAAEFWYADRLPGEPAAGVNDLHVHPLEPFGWRISLTRDL